MNSNLRSPICDLRSQARLSALVRHLYVHIPFCPKICPYCNFYKEASDRNKTPAFLTALMVELDQRIELGLRCETIFFGGGTPSALTVRQLEFLLGSMRKQLDLSGLSEWTLEMNPATVSLEKARLLRQLGVTRISMGVQSFDSKLLERLGRVHTAGQAVRSYELLREAGFTNVNLDFIFGIPGQSIATWEKTLQEAISLRPEHISAYCLTYEEDTDFMVRLQRREFRQDEQKDADLFMMTMDLLADAGYEQYEISNYARPGFECRHNLAYWEGKDYIGLGPSAFSTVGQRRWQNVPDTSRYVEQVLASGEATCSIEDLTPAVRRSESLAFGLRTNRGLTSSDVQEWLADLHALREEGYFKPHDDRFILTRKGRMVADTVAELFV
jgi:oxygen-independent coproporphyrinogen III oxidase